MRRVVTAARYDAIVLGAGAAGLMCAGIAGQRGRRVLLVDHADRPGKKILISGGGRCNFTNLGTAPDRYLSANPHFARSALGRYTAADFLALIERYRIAWHEKTLGQLFCDGSAKQIVDMLWAECPDAQVELSLGRALGEVMMEGGAFTVTIGRQAVHADRLVIATGGPSIPKMGATDLAFRLAKQFRLKLVEPRPGLVPMTLGEDQALFRSLSGVAAEIVAAAGRARFREAALFTHRGLSGPAILQASSYWRHGEEIGIDFLPDAASDLLLEAKAARPRATVRSVLGQRLPDRLAGALDDQLALPGELANLPDRGLRAATQRLRDWRFKPTGTEGYAKAEVTAGGVSTDELSQKTMEAKAVPGLHIIGEAVDVTGWLGGYNFQWAWASGWAAGQAI